MPAAAGDFVSRLGAPRPTGSVSGPRPASQPAQASAGIVTPGKNQVQSIAEWMPNAITTASIVTSPACSAAARFVRRGAQPRVPRPSVRPEAIAQATSNARLSSVPISPKSANVSIT